MAKAVIAERATVPVTVTPVEKRDDYSDHAYRKVKFGRYFRPCTST